MITTDQPDVVLLVEPLLSSWTTMPDLDELDGLAVTPSSALPMRPSPREDARRIVRHGFADAGMWPRTAGEVGPRPGEPIRAIRAGSLVYVDRDMADQIWAAAAALRERLAARRRAEGQTMADNQAIATALGVRRVSRLWFPHCRRTVFRAHLEREGEPFDGVKVVYADRDLARHPNTTAIIVTAARDLRAKLAERKLDEEDAARGGAGL